MSKESKTSQSGTMPNVSTPGEEKKKRLAAALRRNLAERKDTKEVKIVDKPVKE